MFERFLKRANWTDIVISIVFLFLGILLMVKPNEMLAVISILIGAIFIIIGFLKIVDYFSVGAQLIMFVALFALLEFAYKINWRYLLFLAVFVSAAQHAADSLGKAAYFAIMRDYVNFSAILYRVLEVTSYAVVYVVLAGVTVALVQKGCRVMRIKNLPLLALCIIMLVAVTTLTYLTFGYDLDVGAITDDEYNGALEAFKAAAAGGTLPKKEDFWLYSQKPSSASEETASQPAAKISSAQEFVDALNGGK